MANEQTRRWIVTGASRGIGLAVARQAIAEGDQVAMFARSPKITEIAASLGRNALGISVDVADASAVDAALQETRQAFGGIDVLVNNAGAHRGGLIENVSDADWETVLDTNLSSPFRLMRALRPLLNPGAAIVNVGAVVGFRGFPGDSPYGASKAGLAGLTRVLAVELARDAIRVNLVVPGFVRTAMTEAVDDRARERILGRIPMRREGSEAEIAEVIVWVSRARYMTGAVVPVDGGLSANL